jgi:putative two-component system response regulator
MRSSASPLRNESSSVSHETPKTAKNIGSGRTGSNASGRDDEFEIGAATGRGAAQNLASSCAGRVGMAPSKVLVADDEESIRHILDRTLRKAGFEVVTAVDGANALEVFAETKPDIVLLDINMPRVDGLEVCERLRNDPASRLTPIIMVTSATATEMRVKGIEAGANDFLSKPLERVELIARIRSLLRLKSLIDDLESAESVLCALAVSIEGKDPYTGGHCERLSAFGEALGRRLGLSDEEQVALRRGGIVHDIGKVAVPDAILLKPGPLSPEERAIMREHPVVGERICSGLKSFRLVLPIIRHHHEKLDGSGYPDGLQGDAIPLTARVLQVVDVFDALTTRRPYRVALSTERTLEIMRDEARKGWWSGEIVEAFAALLSEQSAVDLGAQLAVR